MNSKTSFSFEKNFSFIKIVSSLLIHFILSVIIGPIIILFLFILYNIASGQNGLIASYITPDSLYSYWFVIIFLLMFGLVWLGFINNKKDSSLSEIKCHRWWTEYWIHSKKSVKEMIDLPEEAEEHFDVKIIKMDKKFAWLLGLFILSAMSIVVSIVIFFTKDTIRKNLESLDLVFSEYQWLIGFSFFILLAIGSILSAFYVMYRYFFSVNREHFYWKRFWLGFVLYSIRRSNSEFNEDTSKSDTINNYIDGFKNKYSSISDEIDLVTQNSDMSLDQKVWLETKLEELESSPSFLIPKSWSLIATFYGFVIIIAGSVGNLLAGPISDLLTYLLSYFI